MEENNKLSKWLNDEMNELELNEFKAQPDYEIFDKIKKYSSELKTNDFDESVMLSNILSKPKSKVIKINSYQKWIYRVAAILVISLGLFFAWNSFSISSVTAENGTKNSFDLPDHSKVVLNSGSEIEYKKWGWENNRKLTLKGEAYFRVHKGSKFEVGTPLGKVTVLGTQFNVKERDNRFEVTCYEGKVRVNYQNHEKIITKGMSIAFEDGKIIDLHDSDLSSPEWMQNELYFYKEDLKSIIKELERQYDIKIEAKTDFSNQEFTGTIPSNNIDIALKIISTTYHLESIKKNNLIILDSSNESK